MSEHNRQTTYVHFAVEQLIPQLELVLLRYKDETLTAALIQAQENASPALAHLLKHVEMTVREIQIQKGVLG